MKTVKWVVQNNLYNEAGYVRFIDALKRLGMNYEIVKPVPFTNILLPGDFDSMTQNVEDVDEPQFDTTQKIIAMGATSLSRISKAKGWSPGTYLNDNFHFPVWRDGFGNDQILSDDAVVGKITDFVGFNKWDNVFIRPTRDTKAFSGMVLSKYDLQDWILQHSILEEQELVPLHKNTEIILASAKKIYAECRIFAINSHIVTASMYKHGSLVRSNADVDSRFIDYAADRIRDWKPAKAFVIDVADTPKGLKIIEINCINSAGFYAADVQKIIMGLHDLEVTE